MDRLMPTLNDLYQQGRMTWTAQGKGWIGRPDEVLGALAADGFYECHRERATSPSGRRPTEGAWDGKRCSPGSSCEWRVGHQTTERVRDPCPRHRVGVVLGVRFDGNERGDWRIRG